MTGSGTGMLQCQTFIIACFSQMSKLSKILHKNGGKISILSLDVSANITSNTALFRNSEIPISYRNSQDATV